MNDRIPIQIGFLQEVIYLIESGRSVREAVLMIQSQSKRSHFINLLSIWMKQKEVGVCNRDFINALESALNRKIFSLLERGVEGESILKYLFILEAEAQEQLQIKRDKQMALLTTKLLIPLLFFIFPAYLILLIVPLMSDLTKLLE